MINAEQDWRGRWSNRRVLFSDTPVAEDATGLDATRAGVCYDLKKHMETQSLNLQGDSIVKYSFPRLEELFRDAEEEGSLAHWASITRLFDPLFRQLFHWINGFYSVVAALYDPLLTPVVTRSAEKRLCGHVSTMLLGGPTKPKDWSKKTWQGFKFSVRQSVFGFVLDLLLSEWDDPGPEHTARFLKPQFYELRLFLLSQQRLRVALYPKATFLIGCLIWSAFWVCSPAGGMLSSKMHHAIDTEGWPVRNRLRGEFPLPSPCPVPLVEWDLLWS